MASPVSPLRRVPNEPEGLLAGVRARAEALAIAEGHSRTALPNMCVYRFANPTVVHKSVTFGVTLGVVVRGEKRVRINGHELSVDPQRLLVITREHENDRVALSPAADGDYLGISLCFGPDRVARALLALREAGGPVAEETVPAFVLPCDPQIADILERLLRTFEDPLDLSLIAPLAIDELLFRLLRSDAAAAMRSAVARAPDASRILDSMQHIRAHYTEKLSVEILAKQVAMSASHYAHRFRAVARTTPMRYLREVRLEQARELLLREGARAADVAMEVGFESPAHFTREFKRRFGVPPSHYLRGRAAG